jgi:hypothetical protein
MTTTDTRTPIWRRRWAQATGAVLALALIGGAAAGGATLAGSHATVIRPAANTAPATPKAPKATPKPGKATPPAPAASSARPVTPAPAGPDTYAQDILNAGITAPVSWIDSTGQKITADWRAGYTAAWTDANVLTPGGVYSYHLATFDQITARDFGVNPPAQGIQPSAPAQPSYPNPDGPCPGTWSPGCTPIGSGDSSSIPSGTYADYVAQIHAAGIVAPDTWIVKTGTQIVQMWRNGATTWDTDQVLSAGGILPGHLATFDQITEQYFSVYPSS